MEYMVSVTPVMTTRFSGMSEEYEPYLYILDDETVCGIEEKLKYLLCLPAVELHREGAFANDYVLSKKQYYPDKESSPCITPIDRMRCQ